MLSMPWFLLVPIAKVCRTRKRYAGSPRPAARSSTLWLSSPSSPSRNQKCPRSSPPPARRFPPHCKHTSRSWIIDAVSLLIAPLIMASPANCEGCARYARYRPYMIDDNIRQGGHHQFARALILACTSTVWKTLQGGWRVADFAYQARSVFGCSLEEISRDVF